MAAVWSTVSQALVASALPRLEAQRLLAHVTGWTRETLLAHPERALDAKAAAVFAALAARRQHGEPLAYLVGGKEFYGREFVVSPAVLVPRPETELLVDAALAFARARPTATLRVLDLGTGSGCLAVTLALEWPAATVTAVDASADALAVATENARRLHANVAFAHGDWYAPVAGPFDLIVANPPYVAATDPHLQALRFEPALALTDGADGLSCLRQIIAAAPAHLAPGGAVMVEHGFDQAGAVAALMQAAGLREVVLQHDLAGQPRLSWARRAE